MPRGWAKVENRAYEERLLEADLGFRLVASRRRLPQIRLCVCLISVGTVLCHPSEPYPVS
jgi:hypothetical protein